MLCPGCRKPITNAHDVPPGIHYCSGCHSPVFVPSHVGTTLKRNPSPPGSRLRSGRCPGCGAKIVIGVGETAGRCGVCSTGLAVKQEVTR